MIINYTSRVIRMAPQFGASLPGNTRSVIYDCNMFIIQATGILGFSYQDSIIKDSINWDSINWDSVSEDSISWDSVIKDLINWDSVIKDSINGDSVIKDSVTLPFHNTCVWISCVQTNSNTPAYGLDKNSPITI
jgi:hypothetical protein